VPAAFTAPPQESTAVRKAPPKIMGDFDFSELEELARTGVRKPEPARPAEPAAPVLRPAAPPPPIRRSVLAEPANAAATQRIPVMGLDDLAEPGERFGQYTLLERIAAGGMAEVWKARMRGVEGFQKTVAIKKILPHMTDNLEFISMFVDEAKLAAQLSHPNIVHIYDLGKIGREYYIAMEYVEGKDLRSLLNAGRRKGAPLPLGLALLIAARLASALEYAHRKRDFEDRELGLVHRDVSPQNVLLTFEGDVKLCDFGIAKAVSKAGHTQMGALKGKLQYMSPEQAWGRPVDPRSDIFSLGVVTFEMITGEKLFPGDTEISVLEAVRQGRIRPPRQVNPAVPLDVEEIVLRAVAADPQDRFQSAGEMKARIEGILAALTPAPSHTDLAGYMHRVLDDLPIAEPDFNQATPPAAAAADSTPPPVWVPEPEPLPPPQPIQPAQMPPQMAPPVEAVAPLIEVVPEGEAGRKGRGMLYAAIAALLILGALAFLYFNNRRAGSPPPAGAEEASPAPAAPPQGAVNQPAEQSAAPAIDIEGMVSQQVAKQEEELRRQLDEKQRKLEREVAAARAAGKQVPTPAAVPTASTPAPEPAAQSAAEPPDTGPPPGSIPPPETRPEPDPKPPRAQERASAPPPEPVRAPEPEPAPAPAAPRVNVGDLVTAGPGVIPPQLVSSPKPEYPPMARNLRVEGIVVVSILVDENGRVQDVRMADPIEKKVGINEAALDAARRVTYKPATKEGVRVKMWTRLRIPFKL
jgi:TonB family protein